MADDTDEALLAAIARGDQEALGRLLERHVDSIYRYLLRLTRSPTDSEDLSQETWLRVWQKANTYRRGSAQPSTWLHRIAHNLFIDSRRRHKIDEVEHNDDIEVAQSVEQSVEQERLAWLNNAMIHLPIDQRSALVLCHWQGFSNREAAVIMGVSTRALESLLARGRRALRERLASSQFGARESENESTNE